MDEFGDDYDEGSDIDNWEDEQVFLDHVNEYERGFEDELDTIENIDETAAEAMFRDVYQAVFGTRPVFSVGHLSDDDLQARIENLVAANAAGRFIKQGEAA